jgi:hypothetical protein
MELARRIEIISVDQANAMIADAEEVGRMLHGLVVSLERGR